MQLTYNGETYEFKGEYAIPQAGDYYLSGGGGVIKCKRSMPECDMRWAIVRKVPRYHELGGVRYAETGEYREMGRFEVATDSVGRLHHPVFSDEIPPYEVSILRPVEVICESE